MLLFRIDASLLALGVQVGIVDLARLVHRDGCRYGAIGAFEGAVVERLERILLHHHVGLHNQHARVGGNGFPLGHLQHQQVVGRWMVGDVRQVHQAEAVLARGFFEPAGILVGAEVVVDRIGERHVELGAHDGPDGVEREINRVFYRSQNVKTFHYVAF